MADRPTTSPWGKIQSCKTQYPGVFFVSTEGHGGIMMNIKSADELLSPAALKCGENYRGFICFEEDCQASIVIREMLDKGLWKIPANYTGSKEEYSERINASLIQWNPEYWEEIGRELPFDVLEKRLYERLKQNFSDYCEAWLKRKDEPDFLTFLSSSHEISSVNGAYSYLIKTHDFELSELQYLMQFQNPLKVVADSWPRIDEIVDAQSIMHEVFDRQDALHGGEYPLVSDTPGDKTTDTRDKPGKPSILGQVKENQDIVKNGGGTPKTATKENEKQEEGGAR